MGRVPWAHEERHNFLLPNLVCQAFQSLEFAEVSAL